MDLLLYPLFIYCTMDEIVLDVMLMVGEVNQIFIQAASNALVNETWIFCVELYRLVISFVPNYSFFFKLM